MNKVPFELELKRRGCRWQSHCPSIHLCVWLVWALTLFQGPQLRSEGQLQYLKPGIFAQALVHNKFVFTLPKDVRGDKADLQVLASHAYSSKKFWYVDCKILSPEVPEDEKIIQMPVVRGNTPTTNHKHNLRDLFNRIYQNPTTLADIGITRARVQQAASALAAIWDTGLVSLSLSLIHI